MLHFVVFSRTGNQFVPRNGGQTIQAGSIAYLTFVEYINPANVLATEVTSRQNSDSVKVVVHDRGYVIVTHIVCGTETFLINWLTINDSRSRVDFVVVVSRSSTYARVAVITLVLVVEAKNVHELMHDSSSAIVAEARWIELHSRKNTWRDTKQ